VNSSRDANNCAHGLTEQSSFSWSVEIS
jgi:hypothetical protein